MEFFSSAAGLIGKLTISLGARSLGEELKDMRTQRRMARLVEDAVDRIVEQVEEYLRAENVSDHRKNILITALCAKLQPLVDDPQRFFAGDLDGSLIFKRCHPNDELPQEIRDEQLGQFYTVLFPQIAHFLAGSRIALAQWQAEGFREEFKRLSQIAEEIRSMNAKVADMPGNVVSALTDKADQQAETLLREFAQTLLNSLLLRLDLSPLRAERALYGALGDHFVIPGFRERLENAKPIGDEQSILNVLAAPGARRIVHGGAGVGKTTWSLWLQSRFLRADPIRLAVVLRLRAIVDIEKHSLLDLLQTQAGAHLRDALTDQVLRKWHSAGRLVVILDGFDEVPEERRDAVEKWVKDLAVVAMNTVILVTSRPIQSGHLEDLKKPWQQWDLLPFDEKRIVEFIERWHRYLPESELSAAERKVDTAALARTFFKDPSLKPLADTPLMLGTLLFVHHRDKKLPSGRVDLYERYIAAMLGLRDSGLGIQARATKLSDREKRRVLAHIALHFHLHGVNEVNDDTIRALVIEALTKFRFDENVERLLPALRERTGLLQGPGAWSFMHKTIGEFLVAELVCDGTTSLFDKRRLDRKELWAHRHEDAWTVVLFFWAGKTTQRELEEFIGDLLDEEEDRAALLALSLLHDQGDRLTHESQRGLALRMVQKWPSRMKNRGGSIGVGTTPCVPSFAYREYQARNSDLRGLTNASCINALSRLLKRGVLVSGDMSVCHKYIRGPLTVATLWAMSENGSCVSLDARHDLGHLPQRDRALYCYNTIVTENRSSLADWLKAFPEGREWIPLLLLSAFIESDFFSSIGNDTQDARPRIGPLCWEWRNESVAKDWLLGSDNCRFWGRSGFDLIKVIRESLQKDGASTWGVSAEQHADLLTWCDRMMARRAELKAIEKK
ncbi:MAG: NACHT domain-containing protein [Verrucomicrobiia bacterium]